MSVQDTVPVALLRLECFLTNFTRRYAGEWIVHIEVPNGHPLRIEVIRMFWNTTTVKILLTFWKNRNFLSNRSKLKILRNSLHRPIKSQKKCLKIQYYSTIFRTIKDFSDSCFRFYHAKVPMTKLQWYPRLGEDLKLQKFLNSCWIQCIIMARNKKVQNETPTFFSCIATVKSN